MLEKEVVKQIDQDLSIRNMMGEVEWYTRLNSGKVRTQFGSWIKLCESGTPDFIALVRNKQNGITVLFIEAKGEGGSLRTEQIRFAEVHNKKKDFFVIKVDDISQLRTFINEIAVDKLEEIKWPE